MKKKIDAEYWRKIWWNKAEAKKALVGLRIPQGPGGKLSRVEYVDLSNGNRVSVNDVTEEQAQEFMRALCPSGAFPKDEGADWGRNQASEDIADNYHKGWLSTRQDISAQLVAVESALEANKSNLERIEREIELVRKWYPANSSPTLGHGIKEKTDEALTLLRKIRGEK